ncbi:MAG TPA: hypothetical protein VNJ01_00390 [Bacteriovoracaceae bacterium]|nr:hypothetical protein [Bacteriovoracaceae bacterium]
MKVVSRFTVISCLFLSTHAFSSVPPCSKWEVLIREHEVQAYERRDGSHVSGSNKKDHCRFKFPKVIEWQEKFTDKTLTEWPLKGETFKAWSHMEKEVILKILQEQPEVFRKFKDLTFLRGTKSKTKDNPA